MLNRYLLAALLLALSPVMALAADATTQLRQFISTVHSATGEFTQQTVNASGQGRPAQSGKFSFKRPGMFKWDVKKPYEQLIVSDGRSVYQYDPDLAQVTQRSVDQSIGASPAAILFGSGSLDEAFVISALPAKDGLSWLRAIPRTTGAGFTHVDMGFKNNAPVRLDVLDAFGQTTRIGLNHIVANPALAANEFKFVPPEGVDVVRMQ